MTDNSPDAVKYVIPLTKEGKEKTEIVNELLNTYRNDRLERGALSSLGVQPVNLYGE